jgi:protein-tyrosine phosphatase
MADPFRILTVCHGNICRSPVAEYLLRQALPTDRFAISSAGTGAVVGWGVYEAMDTLLKAQGIDAADFAARQLNFRIINDAELILTMTLRQRAWIAEEVPAAIRRTFTMREFARLAAAVRAESPDSVQAMVAAAAASRAVYALPDGDTDEIADPYGLEQSAYQEAFTAIEATIPTIKAELTHYPELRSAPGKDPFADFVL